MSSKKNQELGFNIAAKELSTKLKETLDKVLKVQSSKNLPLVYRNKLCIKKNQFIHEYANGRKFLIQQNQTNSEEVILREF